MRSFPRCLFALAVLAVLTLFSLTVPAGAVDDHLLLCEVALQPTAGEFVEVVNTTATSRSLAGYYLSDDADYALLPGAYGAGPVPSISQYDFIAGFPAGATIAPCGVVVVALRGADFLATYGFRADFEIHSTDPGTPNMVRTDVGSSAGLTDDGEGIALFRWDGVSDLVADVDLVNAGIPSASNAVPNKTGLFVDGPDYNFNVSTYQPETTLANQDAKPGSGKSTKRATLEGGLEAGGGNGTTGDAETSEDLLASWDSHYTFIAANPGDCRITPTCYYAGVRSDTPQHLRADLHALVRDHHRFPYTSTATDVWDLLALADQDPLDSNRVLDLYRNASYPKAWAGNDYYQREHTWPKSFGFPDETDVPYTDVHALFAADSTYNNARRNRYYAFCPPGGIPYPTLDYNSQGGSGHPNYVYGPADFTGLWETWDGRRGDVARAQLYMDVRYEGGVHAPTGKNEPDLVLVDDPGLIVETGPDAAVGWMGVLSDLLEWHRQDGVSLGERVRHEVVFLYQRNRNPFVDHPEWAEFLHHGLFADGFESGDLTVWAFSSP